MKKLIRPYISAGITFAFIVLVISGIALYFAPSCRVARTTGWQFLFICKETWEAFHMVFAIVFLILGILHIYINWNILLSYLQNRSENFFNRPLIITAAVTILFIILSLLRVPPVSWLTDFNEQFKGQGKTEQFRNKDHRGKGRRKFHKYRQDRLRGSGEYSN